jgi:riboflavin kinase/FMN adenylyltransferase
MTALTIGFFDGVHLGHQALLQALRKYPRATIITFSNHPRSVFKPPAPPLLTPIPEKIALLQPYADEIIVLPFTLELAAIPFDAFLSEHNPSHLVLGAGSAFGKNREGNEANVRAYAATHGITVEYIPKLLFQGEPVSSSRIRRAIAAGDLILANQLTGRT